MSQYALMSWTFVSEDSLLLDWEQSISGSSKSIEETSESIDSEEQKETARSLRKIETGR